MGFKENIKKRRLELNMTLEEVSNRLRVSKPTLQRYESGVISNIPFDKIELLADILETTPSCLMGWCDFISKKDKQLIEDYNSLDKYSKEIIDYVIKIEKIRNNK